MEAPIAEQVSGGALGAPAAAAAEQGEALPPSQRPKAEVAAGRGEGLPRAPWPRPAAGGGPEWAYAVWRAPGAREDMVGMRTGGGRAWRGIAERLPGRGCAYRDGARLRRFPDAEQAAAAYEEEAKTRGAPVPPRRFYW